MDAHWDVPRILHYFFQIAWPQTVAVRVHLYDRLEQRELGADVRGELNLIDYATERDARRCYDLHIFNHMSEGGDGYHFDLLWPTGIAMAPGSRAAIPLLPPAMQALVSAGGQMEVVRHVLATRCHTEHIDDAEWVNNTRTHLRLALDLAGSEPPTDATVLQLWKDAGHVPDKSVGEDCSHALISALWKSLRACGVLPCDAGPGTTEVDDIVRRCRAAMVGQGRNTSLNWWRDSGAVVRWLLNHVKAEPTQNLRLQCADRHRLEEIAPSISTVVVHRARNATADALTLRIYAYSTLTGKEWRHDAISPIREDSHPSARSSPPGQEATAHAGSGPPRPSSEQATDAERPRESGGPCSPLSYDNAMDAKNAPNPHGHPKTSLDVCHATHPDESHAAGSTEVKPCDEKHFSVAWMPEEETGPPPATEAARLTAMCEKNTYNGHGGASTSQDISHAQHQEDRSSTGDADLKTCVQNFLGTRAKVPICVCDADVALLRTKWQNLAEVGALLQTWLGASVPAFEPTRKNAHVLAKAWMRYHVACNQGPPRTLRTPPTQESKGNEGRSCAKAPSKKATATAPGDGPTSPRQRSPPKKRYRTKAPQEASKPSDTERTLEEDEYWLGTWKREHGNPDPRAITEAAIQEVADLLRPQPLWPTGFQATDPAVDLPTWHCAFRECSYETETFDALQEHILCKHVKALRKVTDLQQPPLAWEAAGMEAYRAALTAACQAQAPTAHAAVDRRCLRQFQAAKDDDAVGAAICFFCARRFPHVETGARRLQDHIMWRRLLGPDNGECLGATREQVNNWFGYDTYWERYGKQHGDEAQALLQDQLQEWQTTLHYDAVAPLRIICCPEDKVCSRRCAAAVTCPKCKAPVCDFCWVAVHNQKTMPATALANDMLMFFAPKMIYQMEVTFMELVCASPCFTAMCCFSLEKKLLGDRALDQDAFMPRQRLAARGNATTFPLAWEDMLRHLETAAAQASSGSLKLPRLGSELAETMSVIIKTMETSRDKEALSQVIHQARVRRAVVLKLIQEAQLRDHPAYKLVDWTQAVARADTLPENGVPEEIVAILPHDEDLRNVLRQKAATPVREHLTLDAVATEFAHMCKPNAVVNEKSCAGMGDVNAQQVTALEATLTETDTGEGSRAAMTIATGNRVLDQFEPWYFAFAFAYVFPFCTAMPDPPAWSKKPRYRRAEDAPRVDLEAWMRCMARRCEAQVNRDWVFGFASWNIFFRSSVNLSPTVHAYTDPVYDEAKQKIRTLTAEDIEEGAVQLVRALSGQYIDTKGKPRPVNGDVSKLQYVRNLKPAARKLLRNMRHTARGLPGTQEARRQMRFEIEAMRIRYGVPLFVTLFTGRKPSNVVDSYGPHPCHGSGSRCHRLARMGVWG